MTVIRPASAVCASLGCFAAEPTSNIANATNERQALGDWKRVEDPGVLLCFLNIAAQITNSQSLASMTILQSLAGWYLLFASCDPPRTSRRGKRGKSRRRQKNLRSCQTQNGELGTCGGFRISPKLIQDVADSPSRVQGSTTTGNSLGSAPASADIKPQRSDSGLSFDLGVLSQQFPFRVDLETRLFPIGSTTTS